MPGKSARCIIIPEHAIARFIQHTATWDQVYSRGGKSPYTIPTVVDDHVRHNRSAPQSHGSWYFDIVDGKCALSLDIQFERLPSQMPPITWSHWVKKANQWTVRHHARKEMTQPKDLRYQTIRWSKSMNNPSDVFTLSLTGQLEESTEVTCSQGYGLDGLVEWAKITIEPGSLLLNVKPLSTGSLCIASSQG